ncbi:hypothetical protein [Streptomyces sp. NBC_01546]|uniref:hypothetical protein n=1 Tax=Streptomyces sp. NBC_01546 TaxID=2975872 RepID=UPI00386949F9
MARALPGYVSREHDRALGEAVRDVMAGHSRIVVLVGTSSTGKTRACWEAVQPLVRRRAALPQQGHRKDELDENELADLSKAARTAAKKAADARSHAALAAGEQKQRRDIAEKYPKLHDAETKARAAQAQPKPKVVQQQHVPAASAALAQQQAQKGPRRNY